MAHQRSLPKVKQNKPFEAFLDMDGAEELNFMRQHIKSDAQPSRRGRGHGSSSKYRGQRGRQDQHRERKNAKTLDLVHAKNTALLSSDKAQSLVRVDTQRTTEAVSVSISTRGIGLTASQIFFELIQYIRPPNVPACTIYQFLRVALGVLELKIFASKSSVSRIPRYISSAYNGQLDPDIAVTLRSVNLLPDPILQIIRQIGSVEADGDVFVPILPAAPVRQGFVLPAPEVVVLSNYRAIVVALAEVGTPVILRRYFHQYNPFPGFVWGGGDNFPLLQNPDEIIPAAYGQAEVAADVRGVSVGFDRFYTKKPKYNTGTVDLASPGSKAMLISGQTHSIKSPDRNAGEPLAEYYNRLLLIGDAKSFWHRCELDNTEMLQGILGMIGEVPRLAVLRNNKLYIPRLEPNARHVVTTSFIAAYGATY